MHFLFFIFLCYAMSGGFVPVDGKTLRQDVIVISKLNRIVILTITSIGVMLTLIFLIINIWYRKERWVAYCIKTSI